MMMEFVKMSAMKRVSLCIVHVSDALFKYSENVAIQAFFHFCLKSKLRFYFIISFYFYSILVCLSKILTDNSRDLEFGAEIYAAIHPLPKIKLGGATILLIITLNSS